MKIKQLHEKMAGRLACPICKAPAKLEETRCVCTNQNCGAEFPVVGGVPILIHEKNSLFRIQAIQSEPSLLPEPPRGMKGLLLSCVPSISLNLKARANYQRLSQILLQRAGRADVLVLGAGQEGQGIRQILDPPKLNLVETDIGLSDRAGVVADAHDIPFLDQTFDAVVVQAVLEHVADPFRCVSEIHRVLKKGGLVYAETPFMQQVHTDAYDFTRFTATGHRRLFRHFKEIASGAAAGPGMTLAWSLSYFFRSFSRRKGFRRFHQFVLPFFIFWLKYFDYFLVDKPQAEDSASVVYFLGERAEAPLSDDELIRHYWKNTPAS